MTVRHLLSGAAIAAASTLLFAGGANAQTAIGPGGFATPPPTLAGFPDINDVLLNTSSSSFDVTNGNQRIAGTLLSSVYRNANNTLDFYYQLTSNGNTNSSLTAFSVTSFLGTTTSVGQTAQDIDGVGAFLSGGSATSQIARESSAEGLTFTLGTSIGGSGNSYTQIVRTNATNFTSTGQAAVLGNGVSANLSANVVAPNTPSQAPEPGSLALAATGLMGAMGMVSIRRRRSAK